MKQSLHTPWSDEIRLLHFVGGGTGGSIQDAQGYAKGTEVARTVFCTFEEGVSQKEFYLSSEAGLRAAASVELWTVDYEGEEFCEFCGKRYKVLRSFKSSFDCTTLILTEVIR